VLPQPQDYIDLFLGPKSIPETQNEFSEMSINGMSKKYNT
jgi:hypothetical protein